MIQTMENKNRRIQRHHPPSSDICLQSSKENYFSPPKFQQSPQQMNGSPMQNLNCFKKMQHYFKNDKNQSLGTSPRQLSPQPYFSPRVTSPLAQNPQNISAQSPIVNSKKDLESARQFQKTLQQNQANFQSNSNPTSVQNLHAKAEQIVLQNHNDNQEFLPQKVERIIVENQRLQSKLLEYQVQYKNMQVQMKSLSNYNGQLLNQLKVKGISTPVQEVEDQRNLAQKYKSAFEDLEHKVQCLITENERLNQIIDKKQKELDKLCQFDFQNPNQSQEQDNSSKQSTDIMIQEKEKMNELLNEKNKLLIEYQQNYQDLHSLYEESQVEKSDLEKIIQEKCNFIEKQKLEIKCMQQMAQGNFHVKQDSQNYSSKKQLNIVQEEIEEIDESGKDQPEVDMLRFENTRLLQIIKNLKDNFLKTLENNNLM